MLNYSIKKFRVKNIKLLGKVALIGMVVCLVFSIHIFRETEKLAKCETKEEFEVFPVQPLGWANTGLAYDSKKDLLVHSRLNGQNTSFLVFTDYKGKTIQSLDITKLISYIQGVTFDWNNDSFWIWGTTYGRPHKPWSEDISLIQISRTGKKIKEIVLPADMNFPGMLAYAGNGTVWIKPNYKHDVYLYDTDKNVILVKIDTGIGGEGIGWDKQTGNLWLHDGVKVVEFDPSKGEIVSKHPSPVSNGASEDVVLDKYGRVWVSADERVKGVKSNKVYAPICARKN